MRTPIAVVVLLLIGILQIGETQNSGEEITKELAQYLEMRTDQTDFSGAILITRKGTTILRQAYGFANRELNVPLSPDHIFRIGSLTKPITAAAVLSLVDKKKLTLDDSVCSYLEFCPSEWKPVLIKHLLSHTSGIPDLFGELKSAPVQKTRAEINRVLSQIKNVPLKSMPGETYAYSNFNYMLLGYVIEIASSEYWEDFLVHTVFEPLEMKNTRYDDVWAIVAGRATGYGIRDEKISNINYHDHSAYAAGGLRSTVDDLRIWHDAYTRDTLISPDLRNRSTAAGKGNYGYGWQVLHLFGHPMYNHTGGIDGFSAHLAYYPDDELRIIVLSNFDGEDSKATACDLAAIVLGVPPVPTGDAEWLRRPRDERCSP